MCNTAAGTQIMGHTSYFFILLYLLGTNSHAPLLMVSGYRRLLTYVSGIADVLAASDISHVQLSGINW